MKTQPPAPQERHSIASQSRRKTSLSLSKLSSARSVQSNDSETDCSTPSPETMAFPTKRPKRIPVPRYERTVEEEDEAEFARFCEIRTWNLYHRLTDFRNKHRPRMIPMAQKKIQPTPKPSSPPPSPPETLDQAFDDEFWNPDDC